MSNGFLFNLLQPKKKVVKKKIKLVKEKEGEDIEEGVIGMLRPPSLEYNRKLLKALISEKKETGKKNGIFTNENILYN